VQSRIRNLRRKARREHARSRRLRARAVAGLAAGGVLFGGALLIAGSILLPDQGAPRLEAPAPRPAIARPPRPGPVEPAGSTRAAYPPAPVRLPDFAEAVLLALPPSPPPAPEPEPPAERSAPVASPPPAAAPAPAQRVVLFTPPPLAVRPPDNPPWRRYAAPAPAANGRPQIAIVIDDVGLNRPLAERTIALKRPVTLAMLPYGRELPALAAAARAAGHELLVHLPMEPENGSSNDPGPNALLMSLREQELDWRIAWNLQRFEGFVGVNNHMGSRFTASAPRMERLILQLKARGLLFLDSKTSEASVGYRMARGHGVPTAERDVFLDNDRSHTAIRARLADAERVARRTGRCIAIGHPYPETLDVLGPWLAAAEARGFALVPVSAVVRADLSG